MGWRKTLSLVRCFEDALTRLSNRVETANNRNAQLTWKNYRKWYLKLIRETKKSLRMLKKDLSSDPELIDTLSSLEVSLKSAFKIESDTATKWSDLESSKHIWQGFKQALDRKIKQEYDLFPQRTFEVDQKLCFVLMPFGKGFNPVYSKAIKPAVTSLGLRAKRADEIFKPTPIVKDIWEHINKATLLIADVTGRNANVFYEVGLGHALPKRLIILTQSKQDVPFDIQYIRWIPYDNTIAGRKALSKKLRRSIKSVLA